MDGVNSGTETPRDTEGTMRLGSPVAPEGKETSVVGARDIPGRNELLTFTGVTDGGDPIIVPGTRGPPVKGGTHVAGSLKILDGCDTELVGIKDTGDGIVAGIPFCVSMGRNGVTVPGRETPTEAEGTKLGLPETPVGSEISVVGPPEMPYGGVAVTSSAVDVGAPVAVSGSVAAIEIVGTMAPSSLGTPEGKGISLDGKADIPGGNVSGTETPAGRDGSPVFGVGDAP